MTSAFSWQNSVSLCPASFCIPRPKLPRLPTLAFQSPMVKKTSFGGVSSRRSRRSSQNCSTSASLVGAQTWVTVILNGLPWKQTEIILSFLRLHPSTAFQTVLLTMKATPFLRRDSCPQQKIQWSSELNSPMPVHFSSLIPKMSMFTVATSCLTTFNLS